MDAERLYRMGLTMTLPLNVVFSTLFELAFACGRPSCIFPFPLAPAPPKICRRFVALEATTACVRRIATECSLNSSASARPGPAVPRQNLCDESGKSRFSTSVARAISFQKALVGGGFLLDEALRVALAYEVSEKCEVFENCDVMDRCEVLEIYDV
jgi:hypothetical protein